MAPVIGWLKQASQDVPATDEWLSPSEQDVLARARVPKRRAEWRLGRWTAKRALLLGGSRLFRAVRLPPVNGSRAAWPRLEVRSDDGGAPVAFLDGEALPLCLSITHRAGHAGCVVGPDEVCAGCDIEVIERREDSFAEDFFTRHERALIALAAPRDRDLFTTLVWSAKESALKALRVGLRADTRSVDVHLLPWLQRSGWTGLAVRVTEPPRLLSGWWKTEGDQVITVVSSPSME
jgi:4'-phosphopantetheinyl transferase